MKKLSKIIVLGIVAVLLFSLAGCDPQRDPWVGFETLEEMQTALPNDFYFFDFDNQKVQNSGYSALMNTKSIKRYERGDFEYVGYNLSFHKYQILNHIIFFSVRAHKDRDILDIDLDTNPISMPYIKNIVIDNIDCALYGDSFSFKLYFNLEEVNYRFQIRSDTEADFLSFCISAIQNRYKVN